MECDRRCVAHDRFSAVRLGNSRRLLLSRNRISGLFFLRRHARVGAHRLLYALGSFRSEQSHKIFRNDFFHAFLAAANRLLRRVVSRFDDRKIDLSLDRPLREA